MNRGNQILATILLLQVVLAVVVFWPRSATAGGELLLADVEAEQVVGVTIDDPAEGQIVLQKSADGWVLPEVGDFPVTESAVSDLLDKLLALRGGRVVAESSSSHGRLQVAEDEYLRLIRLELADGATQQLYLGSAPSYSSAHVRLEGQNEVYLASGLSGFDAPARYANWIDTSYVEFAQGEIAALTLENAQGQFAFQRVDGGDWTMAELPAGETLAQSAVSALVTRISALQMLRPLGQEAQPAYGLEDPAAVITIESQDSGNRQTWTHTLTIGAQDPEEGWYVAKYSDSPYYVRIAEYAAQEWIEKTVEDFLEQPPTPTPIAPPGP